MGISDLIASFIQEALETQGGTAELKRSNIADQFSCVPSQINYVISTRFSPEHGYIVESRRGGGGYIRITQVNSPKERLIPKIVGSMGDSISLSTALAYISNLIRDGEMSKNQGKLIICALSDNALKPVAPSNRDILRASILKQLLLAVNQLEK